MENNQQISNAQRIKEELKNILDNTMQDYKQNPQHIAELLEYQAKFYRYSIRNNILIHNQNPYCTYVASFNKWKEEGYSVNKGAKGLSIFVPTISTTFISPIDHQQKLVSQATAEEKILLQQKAIETSTKTYFHIGYVFDISQTNCPVENYPQFFHMGYTSEQHAELYSKLKAYCENKGFPIEEKDFSSIALRGQYIPSVSRIAINDKLNDTEKLSTLTHEMGHAIMHADKNTRSISLDVMEYEADCISIMLQSKMGLPLTDSRKNHFAEHFHNLGDYDFDKSLGRVAQTFSQIYDEITPFLEKELIIEKQPERKETNAKQTQYTPKYTSENNKQICEAIKENVDIVELARSIGYTPVKEGSLYSLKEHDSVKLYPSSNSFTRYSEMQNNGRYLGGSVIDFVMHFTGVTQAEAIETLKTHLSNIPVQMQTEKKQKEPPKPVEFKLPPNVNGKQSRAFAYLTKTRGIDSSIISSLMKEHIIYEDDHHNVVFCGKNKDGKIVYATKRTTSTQLHYSGDVAGSDQTFGVYINNNSPILVVNEAFIDSMSYMTLSMMKGQDYNKKNYLALGGISGKPVLRHLQENPQISKVILALDNDRGGKENSERIKRQIKEFSAENNREIEISHCVPHAKDFNEDLKNVRERQEKAVEKTISQTKVLELER